MAKLHFGSGAVRLEMDDTLDQIYRRSIEVVAPGVLDRIEEATDEVFQDALAAWPRKTGRSADGLRQQIVVAGDETSVRGTITDAVPYAKYVRPKSIDGKSAYVELLRKPLQAKVKELAEVIAVDAAAQLVGDK